MNLVAFSQYCHHMLQMCLTQILHRLVFFLVFFICLCFSFCNVGSEPLTVFPDMSCGEVTKIWPWCVDSVTAGLAWCESPASAFMLDTSDVQYH